MIDCIVSFILLDIAMLSSNVISGNKIDNEFDDKKLPLGKSKFICQLLRNKSMQFSMKPLNSYTLKIVFCL